ncbi:hypothetical protein GPEL0_01f5274 [Geoanaerobacter pelophilus]|uniref:Uncharacterized protein n=1 Tax=Geoanaerobacter pelophilus TaxID=60036 RepID=A0ABQ0MNY0_9BACT|nr:hypothetical protein GPEL0_01f5274 [Geoanaerobacter pelophilus]
MYWEPAGAAEVTASYRFTFAGSAIKAVLAFLGGYLQVKLASVQ